MKKQEHKLILDLYKHYKSVSELSDEHINNLYNKYGNIRDILKNLILEFEPNSNISEEYLDEKLKTYGISEIDLSKTDEPIAIQNDDNPETKKINKKYLLIFIGIFIVIGSSILFLISNNNDLPNDFYGEWSENEQLRDTLRQLNEEKIKQDPINSLMPDFLVNLYIRKNIFYDSEGWPVEPGQVVLIKDFQKKKEYKLENSNGYFKRIEKIEIIGKSGNITLHFINGESNKIVHVEKMNQELWVKTYSNSDPYGNRDQDFQEWLWNNDYNLIIKVAYKEKYVFEGKISY